MSAGVVTIVTYSTSKLQNIVVEKKSCKRMRRYDVSIAGTMIYPSPRLPLQLPLYFTTTSLDDYGYFFRIFIYLDLTYVFLPLFCRLKFDQYLNTVPTIGFNCEKIRGVGKAKGVSFLVWDVGGQEKLRPLWRSYTR